ncbi:MAG: glycoside hydrolase family 36 protein, partial [Planctomycetota bacterium]
RPCCRGDALRPGNFVNGRMVEAMIVAPVRGDALRPGNFVNGRTLLTSGQPLRLESATVQESDLGPTLVTMHRAGCGLAAECRLVWIDQARAFRVNTTLRNESDRPLTLDWLSTIGLSGITPFARDEALGRLVLHRFRSGWSSEVRHVADPVERLHLERSWPGVGVAIERIGQTGSMPVRDHYPCLVVEDIDARAAWGMAVCAPGSWDMQVMRRGDDLCLYAGLGGSDRALWSVTLEPGESTTAPTVHLAAAAGGVDEVCDRLRELVDAGSGPEPAYERDLPASFNDWCANWGDCRDDTLVPLIERLRGSGVRYFTIDAGWFRAEDKLADADSSVPGGWAIAEGDWAVNDEKYANGLGATATGIRAAGMVPGLWFEPEVVGRGAARFDREGWTVCSDGTPVTQHVRRFVDLANPTVREHLRRTVIERIHNDGFGYVKLDYNEALGPGIDGPASPGENLRMHLDRVIDFLGELREEVPGLVIELCSAGGHRLEPGFAMIADQLSFSDNHEGPDGPIQVAELHRLLPARKLQIWAVLRPELDHAETVYRLTTALMGRLCLSGQVHELRDEQWSAALQSVELCHELAPLIRTGRSRLVSRRASHLRSPRGWQAMIRTAPDQSSLAIWVHGFGDSKGSEIDLPLPFPVRSSPAHLSAGVRTVSLEPTNIRFHLEHDFASAVLLFHSASAQEKT